MATKKMNAELILRKLAEMRKAMPFLEEVRRPPAAEGRMTDPDGFPLTTAEDFEYAAVAEGLQSLADDISTAVERKRAWLMEQALEIYYKAEELAQDPEHAELIPHVEKMRAAFESDYGHPIPPRKKD